VDICNHGEAERLKGLRHHRDAKAEQTEYIPYDDLSFGVHIAVSIHCVLYQVLHGCCIAAAY
jgi:hypothetical protein